MKKAIEIYQKTKDCNIDYFSVVDFNEEKATITILAGVGGSLDYPQKQIEKLCEILGLTLDETTSYYKKTNYVSQPYRWFVKFNFKRLIDPTFEEKEKLVIELFFKNYFELIKEKNISFSLPIIDLRKRSINELKKEHNIILEDYEWNGIVCDMPKDTDLFRIEFGQAMNRTKGDLVLRNKRAYAYVTIRKIKEKEKE